MSVQKNLERFVTSCVSGAICLQGPWGGGKTHLWKELVKAQKTEHTYVSLFGVNSLAGLKAQIALAAQDQQGVPWWKRRYNLRDVFGVVTRSSPLVPSKFGGGAALNEATQSLAFHFVKKRLICIDDVERRGDNLSLKDVLGLVSYLEEQRSCRVCVILNSGAFDGDDLDVWADQREKVFEAELLYDPSVSQAISVALGPGYQLEIWYADAVKALEDLSVRNVRIIRRIARTLGLVFSGLGMLHESTLRSVVRDLVFLEFCHSGRSLGAPRIEFLKKTSPLSFAAESLNREKGNGHLSADELAMAEKISNYNIDGSDAITLLLSDSVVAGFPTDSLAEAINARDREVRTNAKHHRFSAAWRRYQGDLSAGEDEVLLEMMESWDDVAGTESSRNADDLVRLMREHGRPEMSSRIISGWINARTGGRVGELGGEAVSFFGAIQDPEFQDALRKARQSTATLLHLDRALEAIALGTGDQAAFNAVACSEVTELAAALKRMPQSFQALKELLGRRSDHQSTYSSAGSNAEKALKSIAHESEWNALRLYSTYGISTSERPE